MSIRFATVADQARLLHLVQTAPINFAAGGQEDIARMVRAGTVSLGEDHEHLWGMAAVQLEARPDTLPAHAADRAFVRHLALVRGRSPLLDGTQLLAQALIPLQQHARAVEVVVYCRENWLRAPLLEAGFLEVERVQFMRLSNLQHRSLPRPIPVANDATGATGAEIGPLGMGDLEALARLDAAAFPPRWHFSAPELLPLLMAGHVRGARLDDGTLAGYTALSIDASSGALLERIAVAPAARRRGIGRALLVDALLFARAAGAPSVTLNTQNHNTAAQTLYQAAGFRWTGFNVPIMTKILTPNGQDR